MPAWKRTYRIAGDERIEGTWRTVFIHNLTFHVADLIVYADGIVDCWGLVPFDTFVAKVRSGWVATDIPEGARGSVLHLGTWIFSNPRISLTPDMLIGEVADELARLRGQPTSDQRFSAALDTYLQEMTEENRELLVAAYVAVPAHMRCYLLGDMDNKDSPAQILMTPVGERQHGESGGRVVTPELRERALAYFADRQEHRLTPEQRDAEGDPDGPASALSSVVRFDAHDGGLAFLASNAEREFEYQGTKFPTLDHAYWWLSTDDAEARSTILSSRNGYAVGTAGRAAPRRPEWTTIRLALMLELLRAKYRQHPDLAEQLLLTGEAKLYNGVAFSTYWGSYRQSGTNWLGRLLEIVRSELRLERLNARVVGGPA